MMSVYMPHDWKEDEAEYDKTVEIIVRTLREGRQPRPLFLVEIGTFNLDWETLYAVTATAMRGARTGATCWGQTAVVEMKI